VVRLIPGVSAPCTSHRRTEAPPRGRVGTRSVGRLALDAVLTADTSARLEELRDEARYRRERLELYRARLYSGRPLRDGKLRELQRAHDGAAARLMRAEALAARARRPD
jgi:hypothetical protein